MEKINVTPMTSKNNAETWMVCAGTGGIAYVAFLFYKYLTKPDFRKIKEDNAFVDDYESGDIDDLIEPSVTTKNKNTVRCYQKRVAVASLVREVKIRFGNPKRNVANETCIRNYAITLMERRKMRSCEMAHMLPKIINQAFNITKNDVHNYEYKMNQAKRLKHLVAKKKWHEDDD
jgi:hypothetical protein